jgi:dTDP-glucose 4,6-dehydratase
VKAVLVTGGAGFIGSNFIRFILERDSQIIVINLDALTYAGSLENLSDLPDESRHIFIEGDVCHRELVHALFDSYGIDTVVHFAAETHVDRSIYDPARFIQTNVVGTFTLLEVARQHWLQSGRLDRDKYRFHHVSTDEVYGSLEPEDPPFREDHPYQPNSPYASSKAASDHLVRAYAHTYGLPVTISNCSNNYGPFQFPEKLIPLTVFNAMESRSIPVYGDGKQIRDWLYVEDHCEAVWRILEGGRMGETYNIGGNNQTTNLDLLQWICRVMDEKIPDSPHRPHEHLITFVGDRPGHDRRYAMDTTKMKNDLGWQPRETLVDGIQKTIDWYLRAKDWVQAIRSQRNYHSWLEENYSARGEVS